MAASHYDVHAHQLSFLEAVCLSLLQQYDGQHREPSLSA